ncbi:MAG: hypothetical protein N2595_03565 [bacterium]|nr:hypothetical protein [bacterium]
MKWFDKLRGLVRRGGGAAPAGAGAAGQRQLSDAERAYFERADREVEFEKRYMGELCELEAAIMTVFRAEHELTDRQVDNALEAVLDGLKAKELGRAPRVFNLTPREQKVYEHVWEACEVLQGGEPRGGERLPNPFPIRVCEVPLVVECVKRVRKSIAHWQKRGGAQAYLEVAAEHLGRVYRMLARERQG